MKQERLAPFAFRLASIFLMSCSGGGETSPRPATSIPGPENFPGAEEPAPDPTGTPAGFQEIRFVALGDTGKANAGQYSVAAAIAAKCVKDGCDFGVLLGDNVYPSGVTSADDPQWGPKVADAYQPIGIPFYAVLGNHDYGGSGSGQTFSLGAHQVAYSQQNPWFVMPAEWYAFDEGAATFLGTGTNLVIHDYEDAVAVQSEFFRNAIATSDKPWKISLGHFPYLSNGPHGNAGEYDGNPGRGVRVKQFYEETLCADVDLHLFGHDHSLQVLPGTAACPGVMVTSGTGASPSSLPGNNPAEFESLALGFAYVSVTEAQIVVEMVGVDGSTLFTKTITK